MTTFLTALVRMCIYDMCVRVYVCKHVDRRCLFIHKTAWYSFACVTYLCKFIRNMHACASTDCTPHLYERKVFGELRCQ